MNALIKATAKRYRYTGKERDEESGLYYHGARYYISWLCRWSASDPLERKYAGMSPYNYSFNNPVMWNDINGADPDKTEFPDNPVDGQEYKDQNGDKYTYWNGENGAEGRWSFMLDEIEVLEDNLYPYIIKHGETVPSLAFDFGTTIEALLDFNPHLNDLDKSQLEGVKIFRDGSWNAFKNNEGAKGISLEMVQRIKFDGTYFRRDDEANDFEYFFAVDDFDTPLSRYYNFKEGSGATNLVFGPSSAWTQDLMSYSAVDKGREFFYDKFKGKEITNKSEVIDYIIPWGIKEVFKYGRNEYKHYLGSASLNIFVDRTAQNLIFVIINSSSKWSYNYHWGEPEDVNIKRTSASSSINGQPKKSTILNLYIWKEPIK